VIEDRLRYLAQEGLAHALLAHLDDGREVVARGAQRAP
jgi:hypothetical protein